MNPSTVAPFQSCLSASEAFVGFIPHIRRCLRRAFARLRIEQREDALQEALANCYCAFARLWERGRQHLAAPATLAMFAVAQWHDGRRVGTPLNGRDVTSVYARRRHGHRVLSLEGAEADDVAQQAILGGRRVSVPDAAAFRIDFPAFLAQLTPRRRQIALSLAQGEAPSAVAVAFGISRCRVSQLRCELHAAWQAFHGETQRVPGAA